MLLHSTMFAISIGFTCQHSLWYQASFCVIRIPANNHNTLKITLKWEISAHDFSRCGELFIISTPNIEKHKEVHVKRKIEGGRECKLVDYIERK